MNVDIDFRDGTLSEIFQTIKNNYERFNWCSMSVKTKDYSEFEKSNEGSYDEEQEVTIKLKFRY